MMRIAAALIVKCNALGLQQTNRILANPSIQALETFTRSGIGSVADDNGSAARHTISHVTCIVARRVKNHVMRWDCDFIFGREIKSTVHSWTRSPRSVAHLLCTVSVQRGSPFLVCECTCSHSQKVLATSVCVLCFLHHSILHRTT